MCTWELKKPQKPNTKKPPKQEPQWERPVGGGSRLSLPPDVAAKPEPSVPQPPAAPPGPWGESRARIWPVWAAATRPHSTSTPAELPSAFRKGKFRHQSELSKEFQFHVFSPRGGTLTDFVQMTTFRGWVRPPTPPLSRKAESHLSGLNWGSCFSQRILSSFKFNLSFKNFFLKIQPFILLLFLKI